MNRISDVKHPDLKAILKGHPVKAIEAAKRIIDAEDVSVPQLIDIATDGARSKWTRIASVYALGFVDDASRSASALVRILGDRGEDKQLRAHAAEALGHLKKPATVPLMEEILMGADAPEVKKWCVYALSEIGGRKGRQVLERFAQTNPTGAVGEELRNALCDF